MGRDNYYEDEVLQFKKNLFESNQYMEWLSQYIQEYGKASSFDLLSPSLSQDNRINLLKIPVLFAVVEDYLKENYVSPSIYESGYYYSIRDGEKHYRIGVDIRDGLEHYCEKSLETDKEVDFSYIRRNEKLPSTVFIDYHLNKFNQLFQSFSSCGINSSMLEEKVLKKIRGTLK